jgi:hypothetical protein
MQQPLSHYSYSGPKSFSAAIDAFAAKVNVSANVVLRKVAFHGFVALVEQSPVDTGAFRSHWRVDVGYSDPYYDAGLRDRLRMMLSSSDRGPGAGIPPTDAIQSANDRIPQAKWGETIYITNRSDYGPEWDAKGYRGLNGGSSPQAPAGWVYQVAREMKDYVESGPVLTP